MAKKEAQDKKETFICGFPTAKGTPCKLKVKEAGARCHIHEGMEFPTAEEIEERKVAAKGGKVNFIKTATSVVEEEVVEEVIADEDNEDDVPEVDNEEDYNGDYTNYDEDDEE